MFCEFKLLNPLPSAGRCIKLLRIIFQISAHTTVGDILFYPLDGGFRRPHPLPPNTTRRFFVTTGAATVSYSQSSLKTGVFWLKYRYHLKHILKGIGIIQLFH